MNLKQFFGGRSIEVDTPMPTPVYSREESLISELHMLDQKRDELAEAMRDFRKQNTLMLDGREMFQTDHVTGAQELRAVWNGLLNADSRLLEARNVVLRELAMIRTPSWIQ